MRFTFNWGWGIVLGLALFIGFIVTLMVQILNLRFDLVTPDYYAQEVAHQEKLDRLNRSDLLISTVEWEADRQGVHFHFPDSLAAGPKGTITFLRPSDQRLDLEVPIAANADNRQSVSGDRFVPGLYQVQVRWQVGTTSYQKEGNLFIPGS